MNRLLALLFAVSLVPAGLTGCNGSEPTNGSGPSIASPSQSSPSESGGFLSALTGGGNQHEDARYTILLFADDNPTHVSTVKRYKQATEQDTGWEGLYVLHKQGRSELYWGKYETVEDARENLQEAKDYVPPIGVPIYQKAVVVPLPGKSFGPPEWNLENADGTYSVLVARFYDVPEADYVGRKQFAVDYARQLREEGEQAYYYHAAAQSLVTIGAFPNNSVRMVSSGKKVKPKIVDPRIKAIMERHEFLAVNGRRELVTLPAQGGARRSYTRSYPVHIPKDDEEQSNDFPTNTGFGY